MLNIPTIALPNKLMPLLSAPNRYIIVYGGRSGAKTGSIVRSRILKMLSSKKQMIILVVRETMASLGDSCHAEFANCILEFGLHKYFKVTEKKIVCTINNSYIAFKGIRTNPQEIKGFANADECWAEEADNISKKSWDFLVHTIKRQGSQILVSFNPKNFSDETYQRFVVNPPEDSLVININYYDNPFISNTSLKEIKEWHAVRPQDYEHIFLGKVKEYSEALIFKNKFEVKEFKEYNWFEVLGRQFYYGADWGYAKDPTCIVRCFILEEFAPNTTIKVRNLYIDYEAGGTEIELTQINNLFRQIPDINKYFAGKVEYELEKQLSTIMIYGDSSRPETISFLSNEGLPIYSCYKTEVEEGIEFLRSFYKIYIHPRCTETIKEFQNYSFKINKNNDKILPEIDKKAGYDHYIDSIRYALSDLIKLGIQGDRTLNAYDYQKAIASLRFG